jgi:hypothetical protein
VVRQHVGGGRVTGAVGKAARTYRRRTAAGLCRDCGRPRGEDGTVHRCIGCARAVAAEKRLLRALVALRDLFAAMAAGADRRTLRQQPLRLRRAGKIRVLRTEGGRPVTHEDVLRALLAAYEINVPRRHKR